MSGCHAKIHTTSDLKERIITLKGSLSDRKTIPGMSCSQNGSPLQHNNNLSSINLYFLYIYFLIIMIIIITHKTIHFE
jgi:hypothetical protein